MRDLTGVFWTRFGGEARKLGAFVITDAQFRTSLEPDALDLPPPAAALLPEVFARRPHIHHRAEALDFPAFVWSKIPQPAPPGFPANIQRRIWARIVTARNPPPPPGVETDYEILMMTGRDGVGHVDFFRSDEAARQFYDADFPRRLRSPTIPSSGHGGLWALLGKMVREAIDDEGSLETIASAVGPTPSMPGMVPKLAVTIPDAPIWDGRTSLPGVRAIDGEAFVDVIVKIEPPGYEGMLALEAIAYDVHARFGMRTPRLWKHVASDGVRLLAIERFDRVNGQPVPMESMFCALSLLGGDRSTIMSPVEGAYETIARALKLSEVALSTRAKTDLVEFFRRFVLSLLTGNGDMHLENIAILGARTDRGLSPVFDPAPMRAFPRHSQLTALRWFTNDAPSFAYIPANLAERLKQLGKHFDVRPRRAREIIAAALDVTSEFDARCRQSEEIPPFTAERLAAEIAGVRYRLEESVKLAAEWA